MIVRRLVTRRPARPVPRERKPKRNRSGRFLLLTLGSGVIAALIALGIEGLPVVLGQLTPPSQPQQIDASTVFKPVGPQHKVVDVYDPAPKQQPKPTPSAGPSPSSSPSGPPRSPRPTPSPDN